MAITALIPKMTAESSPAGVASASSENSAPYAAFNAFNQLYGQWIAGTTIYPQYLQYEAGTGIAVTHYYVGGHSTKDYNPKSWTLKASNDGTSFIDLDARTSTDEPQNMLYAIAAGSCGTYTHHRLEVTNGGATLLVVVSLQLYNASASSDPDTVISTAGGNWKNGGLLSGTAVKSGVTFGLSGTGSLVAEQHTDNEVLKSASVPGNYNDDSLTGSNIRNGVTFGLNGTGSYFADVLTAEQSQKLDELWRFKGFSTVLPLEASGDGVSQKVLTSGTVTLTISGTGVVRT
jgi:hypothetical protein